jgi:hypothetical protein
MGNVLMALNELKKTLSPTNQFCFKCPIFKTEVKLATCLMLRDKVWRGEKIEVRGGCQAAMHDSKCPVVHVLPEMMRADSTGNSDDPYHSVEKVVGSLSNWILKRITPIMMMQRTIDQFAMSPQERQLLEESNSMIPEINEKKERLRPIRHTKAVPLADSKEIEAKSHPVVADSIAAATSGDMTAAINEAHK